MELKSGSSIRAKGNGYEGMEEDREKRKNSNGKMALRKVLLAGFGERVEKCG
jgi:hypothetical protein